METMEIKFVKDLGWGRMKGEDGRDYVFDYDENDNEYAFVDEKGINEAYKVIDSSYDENDVLKSITVENKSHTWEELGFEH